MSSDASKPACARAINTAISILAGVAAARPLKARAQLDLLYAEAQAHHLPLAAVNDIGCA